MAVAGANFRDSGPLKVAYITMTFPAPSETFASLDVRELAVRGVEISVHSIKSRTNHTIRLVKERGLQQAELSHNQGLATLVRGIRVAIKRPSVAFDLVHAVIRYCALAPKHLLKSLILIPRVLEIFGHLERAGPDVVHACWSHYPSMVVYLVQRHCPETLTSISFVAYDIAKRYPLSRIVALDADLVRTLGEVNVPVLEADFGIPSDRIEVIHDGVDLSDLPVALRRVPKRILTAGRLIESKGMTHVLVAFSRVHQKWPDATLMVCGAGPMMGSLYSLAKELRISSAVTFAGHLPHRQVLQEMAVADVFLFLSETERLPNVVKEAMVSGCVCVSSWTPGIEELIKDGVTGFVVAPFDIDNAVERIDSIFKDKVPSAQIRAKAEEHIRRLFALDGSIERYLSIWYKLYAAKKELRFAAHEQA